MTIDVKIDNWKAPGDKWWENVKCHPDEQLIQATITMTLSWDEYRLLVLRPEAEANKS